MTENRASYDLIILEKESRVVLISIDGVCRLPSVLVDASARPARAVTLAVQSTLNISTFVLSWLTDATDRPCAILELLDSAKRLPRHLALRRLSDVPASLVSEQQSQRIVDSFATAVGPLGRFARVGWLHEFECAHWGDDIAEIEQFNCGINFSLFRFTSKQVHYWFKATGEPNRHEFEVTKVLHELVPHFIPSIKLAIEPWNAWVSEETAGAPLRETGDSRLWAAALSDLSSVQKLTRCHLQELRAAGARELTLASIKEELPSLFDEAALAMAAQTSTRVVALSTATLWKLQALLQEALVELDRINIPDAVVHGDLGAGNVIVSTHGTVFLDWAESYIGCPFFSAELLLATADQIPHAVQEQLRHDLVLLSQPQLAVFDRAFVVSLMPVLGPLAAAVITFRYGVRLQRSEPFRPLLRSLMRRMNSAIHHLENRIESYRSVCPPHGRPLHA